MKKAVASLVCTFYLPAVCFLLLLASPVLGAAVQSTELRGTIADETGAVIGGAQVTLDDGQGHKQVAQSDESGRYRIAAIAPAVYTLTVAQEGFATFSQQIDLTSRRTAPLNVTLKVIITEQMQVKPDTPGISVEPDRNLSAITLTGADLEALPDDPDELLDVLRQMAGSTGSPGDATVYVDGFREGGRLPPKEAIAMIRINASPYAAEYSEHGRGRIEIITKPGTSRMHGGFRFNFLDSALNARNAASPLKPSFQSRTFNFYLSGPIIRNRWSFFFDAERREQDPNGVVNAFVIDPKTFAITPFSTAVLTPSGLTNFTIRTDYLATKRNTIGVWYRHTINDQLNQGVGGFNLPGQGSDRSSRDETFRFSLTTTATEHSVNEIRMELSKRTTEAHGNVSGPQIDVFQAFNSGGNQTLTSNTNDNLEYTDNFTYTLNKHTFRAGIRMDAVHFADINQSNFSGIFIFASDFERDSNGVPIVNSQGSRTPISAIEAYRRTLLGLPGYGPSQFSITRGDPFVGLSQWEFGSFIQDDWRVSPSLTISAGLRHEFQTHLQDKLNFAPRFSLAWAPGGKTAKGTIRAGAGVFYSRLDPGITADTTRLDGEHQLQIVIQRPDFFPNVPATFTGAEVRQATIKEKDPSLNAPYQIITSIGYERQLPWKLFGSIQYEYQRGVHLLLTRDINAPLPGIGAPQSGSRPLADQGQILQYESVGTSVRHDMLVTLRGNIGRRFSFQGNYVLATTHSTTDGSGTTPADSYNIALDYGRANYDTRHRFFMFATINLPRDFRISPFITAASGRPFNITTGFDNNGDRIFSDRPAFASANDPGAIVTPFGIFNPNPKAGDLIIPRNFGNGPSQVNLNMNFSKTIGFGPPPPSNWPGQARNQQDGQQPRPGGQRPRGAGGPGGGGRGGAGGFGGGGGGRGGDAGGADQNHKYTVTFNVNVNNILNHTNLGNFNGVLTSPLFGLSNSAAQARRIELAARFNF
jgi:hypothetical protein